MPTFRLLLRRKGRTTLDLGTFRSFSFAKVAALEHLASHAGVQTGEWETPTIGDWVLASTTGEYAILLEPDPASSL
jgi:hypothetical protein